MRATDYLGYAKYSGSKVQDGLMDARKAAKALIGFDEAYRTLLGYQDPHFRDVDFELPIRVQKGSWEVLLPQTAVQWILAGAGVVATGYLTTAATKIAEKDFEGVGTRDIFRGALRGMQWILRIGKHMGTNAIRKFTKVTFRKNNSEIGLVNDDERTLWVPKGYVDMYAAVRPDLLSKLAELVDEDRTLTIGVIDGRKKTEEKLSSGQKSIFYEDENESDEIIFPEMKHDDRVVLDGDLTRGNETSNTLGLKYKDHILTCHPRDGSIVRFKNLLFSPVRVRAVVSRKDEFGNIAARKPHLLVSRIEQREVPPPAIRDLFDSSGD
jgi:hypothetical protein